MAPRNLLKLVSSIALALGAMTATAAPPEAPLGTQDANVTKDLISGVMGGVTPPAFDAAKLPSPENTGATVLKTFCVQCHNLPSPGLHAADEWPAVVNRMLDRIARYTEARPDFHQLKKPSAEELAALVAYLQQHAFKPITVANYPDLDTDIGNAFRATCKRCHALPDPAIHSKDEWQGVVLRMRQNMKTLGVADPGDAALAKVIGFLQANAPQ